MLLKKSPGTYVISAFCSFVDGFMDGSSPMVESLRRGASTCLPRAGGADWGEGDDNELHIAGGLCQSINMIN